MCFSQGQLYFLFQRRIPPFERLVVVLDQSMARIYFPLRYCQIEYPQKSPKPKCNIKSLGYCHTLSFSSETTFFSPTAASAVL